jgi:hypothetical protein
MKHFYALLLFVSSTVLSYAQECPGGGLDFTQAVMFDAAWIYGCSTGTSCNGGVDFDNRAGCQPTTAMDACAPVPSCGNNLYQGSNVWFKFYAYQTDVLLSCFQNTSLVIGIQAFSGGPSCGSLTEIGCAVATGPSSGVQLSLSGLLPGVPYYFRIFGNAKPASQRTGLYCFCGTTGLTNILLPVVLTSFKGKALNKKVELSWTSSSETNNMYYEVEYSVDGKSFSKITSMSGQGTSAITHSYKYIDGAAIKGNNFYRLKFVSNTGQAQYSEVINVKLDVSKSFQAYFSIDEQQIKIISDRSLDAALYNASGLLIKSIKVDAGLHTMSTNGIPAGVYFIRNNSDNEIQKLYITH